MQRLFLFRRILLSLSASFSVYATTGMSGGVTLTFVALLVFVFSIFFQYFALHPALREVSTQSAYKILLAWVLISGGLTLGSLYYLSLFDWLQGDDTLANDFMKRVIFFQLSVSMLTAGSCARKYGEANTKH